MKLHHLVLAFIAWKLFLEKSPRGDVEIGDAEDRSSPDEWKNPFGGY